MASALIFPDLFFAEVSKAARLRAFFFADITGLLPRLLGGLFFACLDDKDGRKSVLVASVLLMGGINLCIVGILLANVEVSTSPMPAT
jgi:MFS transporter, MHS family, metabolite:H+ symporter